MNETLNLQSNPDCSRRRFQANDRSMDMRFGSFVLGMLGLLFLLSWGTSTEGFCGFSVAKHMSKQEHTSCFEFLLFRYQTLITGLLAVIAASAAAIVYYLQLKEMGRQSAVAEKSRAIGRYEAVLQRLKKLPDVYDPIHSGMYILPQGEFIREITNTSAAVMKYTNISHQSTAAVSVYEKIKALYLGYTAGPKLIPYLDNAIECSRIYKKTTRALFNAINDHARNKTNLPDQECIQLCKEVVTSGDRLKIALSEMEKAREEEKIFLQNLLTTLDEQIRA